MKNPTVNFISLEDYKTGFKKWKESITTSSSGRHLCHHHSLLVPDGVHYEKEEQNFSKRMWNIHHKITSIVMRNETPLNRWLTSIVNLLPKDIGRHKIHRLRLMNTCESEYNLILKYFWTKKGIQKAEDNKWLGKNQTGGRRNTSAVETATINEIMLDTHRLTKVPLCIHQDDAKACYDRIIRSHAILNSRKFGIPNNICRLYSITYDKMVFKLIINNGISKGDNRSSKTQKLHGAGQGAGNGGTQWTFISIPMIDTIDKVAQGWGNSITTIK